MRRLLAVAILPAAAFLLVVGSVIGIAVRAGDDGDEPRAPLTAPAAAPVPPAPPTPVNDACSVLPADNVARALGLAPGRVSTIAHPVIPGQGARCSYKDLDANMFVFFVHVQDSPDPAEARDQIEALTGTAVRDLGDVARYEQLEGGDSTINAVSGARQIFLGTRGRRMSQETMAGLAREVLSRAR